MRVLIDTNVLVSALLLRNSLPRRVVDACMERSELVTSVHLLLEIDSVLMRPGIASRVDPHLTASFVDAYKRACILAEPKSIVTVCRDPQDNRVLEAALDANVAFVVTGDADLLVLDPFEGVRIVSPADTEELLRT